MIKYRVYKGWDGINPTPEIKEVEVDRETKHFVIINGNRTAKISTDNEYCDTWEDAVHTLLECFRKTKEYRINMLNRATEQRDKVFADMRKFQDILDEKERVDYVNRK